MISPKQSIDSIVRVKSCQLPLAFNVHPTEVIISAQGAKEIVQ